MRQSPFFGVFRLSVRSENAVRLGTVNVKEISAIRQAAAAGVDIAQAQQKSARNFRALSRIE